MQQMIQMQQMFCVPTYQAAIKLSFFVFFFHLMFRQHWKQLDKKMDQSEYGENFSHQSLLCFAAQEQGSICVLITGPEEKIIISLEGGERAPFTYCSQISSFRKSRLNISKAKWLPSLLAGDQIEESRSICCLTLSFPHISFCLILSSHLSLYIFTSSSLHYIPSLLLFFFFSLSRCVCFTFAFLSFSSPPTFINLEAVNRYLLTQFYPTAASQHLTNTHTHSAVSFH